MEIRQKILAALDQAGWLVLSHLAPWFAAASLAWLTAWWIRRRIRSFRRRFLNAPVAAIGAVAQAGVDAATAASSVVVDAAGRAGAAIQVNALPLAQRAGQAIVDHATAGASMTASTWESAKPNVLAAAAVAANGTRAGAQQTVNSVAIATPVILDAVGAAAGVVATGAHGVGILMKIKADEMLEFARAEQKKRDELRATSKKT